MTCSEKRITMTIDEIIGQKLVIGFWGQEIPDEFRDIVKKYKIGNVILFRENLKDEAQIKELCRDIQELVTGETGIPAFIMIDQEGGMVSRLPVSMVNIPGAMAIAGTGDPQNANISGYYTGLQLRELGCNFDLAPVLDINSNPSNPIIGCRSYGETPEVVSSFSMEMVRGLEKAGVAACGKHFPGHGDVSKDSHVTLPLVDKTLDELEKMELVPFANAINNGIPAIMTAHILFPKIEKEKVPATMSRTILTGLLREKMGFEGMILTDCLEMQAIQKFYGTENGAVAALKAGADIAMISHTPAFVPKVVAMVKEAVEAGDIDLAEMKKSANRIIAYKEKYLGKNDSRNMDVRNADITNVDTGNIVPNEKLSLQSKIEEIRHQSLKLISKADYPIMIDEKTLFISPNAFNGWRVGNEKEDISEAFCEILKERLGGRSLLISENPDEAEIEEALRISRESSFIIVGTYNAHVFKGQLKLIDRLISKHSKIAVFALRDPYDLDELQGNIWKYAAYEYTMPMVECIAKIIS